MFEGEGAGVGLLLGFSSSDDAFLAFGASFFCAGFAFSEKKGKGMVFEKSYNLRLIIAEMFLASSLKYFFMSDTNKVPSSIQIFSIGH